MKTLNLLQASICGLMTAVLLSSGPSVATAQHLGNRLGQETFVDASFEQMEVIVGSSQRLKFGYKIPELLVESPEVVKATPVSPTEILISGLKPGVSSITVSDPEKNLQSFTIQVTADTRKLEAALQRHFPDANIQVHALQTGVVLKGTVVRADDVNTVVAIAKDYFPTTVINRLQVDSGQVVAIKVKVYEVNRSKLKTMGIDWAVFGADFRFVSSVSDIINTVSVSDASFETGGTQTLSLGVFDGNTSFFKFLEALEQNNIARLLDQPTLVAQNGRPAEFLSGGEIPILVASGLGTNSIEFRAFGTKLDMVPLIHGQGELTLEVRAEVSDVDNSLAFGTGVPGFRVRRVNTGVRMKAGHTLALAGDYQESSETEKRGIPFLMDSPLIGHLFRRTTDTSAENELVFLITPQFVSEVDPSQVPQLGPGQLSMPPSRAEMYRKGYVEVPRCSNDCPINDSFANPHGSNVVPQGYPASGSYSPGSGTVTPANYGSSQNQGVQQYPLYSDNPQPTNTSADYGTGFGWPQGNR